MKVSQNYKGLAIFGLIISLMFLFGMCYTESYCFFYPSIDTRFALEFSQEKFDKVSVGMDPKNVIQLTGQPISIWKDESGASVWYYSEDGDAPFGDFAWLVRTVIFRNDKVEKVIKRIAYD